MYNSKYLGAHIDKVVKTMIGDRLAPRGMSNNAASTKGRTVTVNGTFSLSSGRMVVVCFANAISAEGATLSVNSTTAKGIYKDGSPLVPNAISAGDVALLEYDGSHWNVIDIITEGLEGETSHVLSVSGTAAVTSSPYYASRWTGKCPDITALYSGLKVQVKVPVAGNAAYGTVLNVNGLGEHPVCVNKDTAIGTRFVVGSVIELIYDADETASAHINSASASSISGVWKIADYNSDTTYQKMTRSEYDSGTSQEGRLVDPNLLSVVVEEVRIKPMGRYSGKTSAYKKNSLVCINDRVYLSNKDTSNTPVGVLTDRDGSRITFKDADMNPGYLIVNQGKSDDWDYVMDTYDKPIKSLEVTVGSISSNVNGISSRVNGIDSRVTAIEEGLS